VVVDVLDVAIREPGLKALKVLVGHARTAMQEQQSFGGMAAVTFGPDLIVSKSSCDGYHFDFDGHFFLLKNIWWKKYNRFRKIIETNPSVVTSTDVYSKKL